MAMGMAYNKRPCVTKAFFPYVLVWIYAMLGTPTFLSSTTVAFSPWLDAVVEHDVWRYFYAQRDMLRGS